MNTSTYRKLTTEQLKQLETKYLIEKDKLKKKPRPEYSKFVESTLKNIRKVLKERNIER